MIEKDDWRLYNDVYHLFNQYVDPVDGEDIIEHLSSIKKCQFCWNKVIDGKNNYWYLPMDKSCCICEKCFIDFQELFEWKLLDGWDIQW